MPIPKPRNKEKKTVFISRCMGNPSMRKEYPDQKKRAGICYSQWKSKEEQEAEEKKVIIRTDNKGRTVTIFNSFKGLTRLLKATDKKENKQMVKGFRVGPIVIMEAFKSLRQAIEKELESVGTRAYLVDFSNKEIIYSEWSEGHGEKFFKRTYKMKSGVVTFDGTPEKVDRKVTYENADLGTKILIEITDMNLGVKQEDG